jgi:glutathione S-transferase
MQLFYAPGLCSLAPHIALVRTGAAFSLVKVDMATRLTEDGRNFREIKQSGKIPALRLASGEVLTETVAILLYVADLAPESGLAPPAGTFDRHRFTDLLCFLSSEVHKSFVPLFSKVASLDAKQAARAEVTCHLEAADAGLLDAGYCFGRKFTVADAYLFSILGWAPRCAIDLAAFPTLARFVDRVSGEEGVREALRTEGLL